MVTKEGEPAFVPPTKIQETDAVTFNGLPGIDYRHSNITEPFIQRFPKSRHQKHLSSDTAFNSQRGNNSDVSNHGRKRTTGDPKKHRRTEVRSRGF